MGLRKGALRVVNLGEGWMRIRWERCMGVWRGRFMGWRVCRGVRWMGGLVRRDLVEGVVEGVVGLVGKMVGGGGGGGEEILKKIFTLCAAKR